MVQNVNIKYFEEKVEKVKTQYSGDFRFLSYIKYAEEELEAARNGMDSLKKFWTLNN